jgi:hypothetical protein
MNKVTISNFSLKDIDQKCVAIVKFGPPGGIDEGFKPAQFFQVTIDPAKVSSSGDFIRFGNSPGDEITGWQKASSISVLEILGVWPDNDTPPVMPYGVTGKVTMMVQED